MCTFKTWKESTDWTLISIYTTASSVRIRERFFQTRWNVPKFLMLARLPDESRWRWKERWRFGRNTTASHNRTWITRHSSASCVLDEALLFFYVFSVFGAHAPPDREPLGAHVIKCGMLLSELLLKNKQRSVWRWRVSRFGPISIGEPGKEPYFVSSSSSVQRWERYRDAWRIDVLDKMK